MAYLQYVPELTFFFLTNDSKDKQMIDSTDVFMGVIFLFLFPWIESEFQICRYEDMYNLIQTLLLNIGTGVIPLVVMISLYIQVIKVVRKQVSNLL